jgi:hypothetical protein
MPGVISAIQRLKARTHDRAAWYRKHAKDFQKLAEMETRLRVRARLIELADEYTQLADVNTVTREAAD